MIDAPRDAVLVTGAAGFLGGTLLRRFAASGRPAVGLDVVAAEAPGARSLRVDVRDAGAVREAVLRSGASVIVHAAALLPNASRRDLDDVNVRGTSNVLDAARSCGLRRVVFVSSSAVFPVLGAHDEDGPRTGLGAYAASKVAAEDRCAEARAAGLSVAVLRVVPVVGPGRLGLFGLLFRWVREGRRIPMLGDGRNHHQLLDVDDACDALALLADAPDDDVARSFNAGAAITGTVREDLAELCRRAGTGARPVAVPVHLAASALRRLHRWGLSPIHPRVFDSASVDARVPVARLESLGWRPRHSSADALVRAYDWYVAHPDVVATRGSGHRGAWDTAALDALRRLF